MSKGADDTMGYLTTKLIRPGTTFSSGTCDAVSYSLDDCQRRAGVEGPALSIQLEELEGLDDPIG